MLRKGPSNRIEITKRIKIGNLPFVEKRKLRKNVASFNAFFQWNI